MLFKLHYWFLAAGANALGILMGVFMETYTDASTSEIGALFMVMPFTGIIFRPLICAKADREGAHQKYLIYCLLTVGLSYAPFIVVPCLGPQVYEGHPRACWYTLVVLKVLGDIAFGGVISIGDSLAINYSKRIGVEFSVYRVWGTVSWMFFGIVIGLVNEIWFLPKYVPGFIILLGSSMLDALIVYLWPADYFTMVPLDHLAREASDHAAAATDDHHHHDDNDDPKKAKPENAFTKSLMPKEVVWAHAKRKLAFLLTLGRVSRQKDAIESAYSSRSGPTSGQNNNNHNTSNGAQKLPAVIRMLSSSAKREPELDSVSVASVAASLGATNQLSSNQGKFQRIEMATQIRILSCLLRKDPRIVLWMLYFVCAGISIVPLSFFFMSLSQICHSQGTCDFSKLAGVLQFSMALPETVMFMYIKRVIGKIGRINTAALSMLFVAIKYTFYGTLWIHVDPHWSIAAESMHGVVFCIYLTLLAELAHLFANEVEFMIPELMDRGVIGPEADVERIKMSLMATMQALLSSANDGIGRGVGALVLGVVIAYRPYELIWLCIGVMGWLMLATLVAVNLLDGFFHFRLGLDVKAKHAKMAAAAAAAAAGPLKPTLSVATGNSAPA